MGVYLGAGDTAHQLSKLYMGVGGVARQVQKMYVGADGGARLVYQSDTPLSSLAVGSAVKIKVDGTARNFLVVYQGKPSSRYDDSCDGTWLLMQDIYTTSAISGSDNSYKDSIIHSYLNGTFYDLIDADVRNAIKQVKIPYRTDKGLSGSVATGASGLSTKVFLLSGKEVGFSAIYMDYTEGENLPYFDSNSKRIAHNGSDAIDWWLRSTRTRDSSRFWVVSSDGSLDYWVYDHNCGIRPAFIMPSDTLVDENGNVIS